MNKNLVFIIVVAMLACNTLSIPTSSGIPKESSPGAGATPTSIPTLLQGPNENIVIAQLNLWYFGDGCHGGFEAFDCSGKRTTPFEPALGHTYFSSNRAVLKQQID
ncbi:MAG: hypothetical protein A2Y54_07220 [Chloroflexi bacterium RBG_16_51_16]|nr:MAG: hypothetical protein A2Y54_07220 [Chloroflexi bacterium RBG_16_51_16]